MKRKAIAILIILALAVSLAIPALATDTSAIDKQIADLQKQIDALTVQLQKVNSGYTMIIGSIISTDPFMVQGLGMGGVTGVSTSPYYLILNPQKQQNTIGMYAGSHKFLRTESVYVGNVLVKINVMGDMPAEWWTLTNKINTLKAQLEKLKNEKYAKITFLGSYCKDYTQDLVLQIGNPEMDAYAHIIPIDNKGTTPIAIDGTTYLPLRSLIENMGGEVAWDGNTKTVSVTMGYCVITVTVENSVAIVNGKPVDMGHEPIILNSVTLLPLRFITESLGATVDWFGDKGVIVIHYSQNWADHPNNYVIASNNNSYSLRDPILLCNYTYPQQWGTPKAYAEWSGSLINNSGTLASYYVHYNQNVNDSRIPAKDQSQIKYKIDMSIVKDPTNIYSTIDKVVTLEEFQRVFGTNVLPLTSANTGIQEIVLSPGFPNENTALPYAHILYKTGRVVRIDWTIECENFIYWNIYSDVLNELRNRLNSDAIALLNSLSVDEPMG